MVKQKIIRVPEKLYIQTLIAGKSNASIVVDDLQLHKITVPTNDMKAIYDELVTSNPVYFQQQDPTIMPDDEWVESVGLSPMYYYRFKRPADVSLQGIEGAFRMLEDPKMVKYINVLTLAGVNPQDLELILNAKYNISFDSPDFEMYLKYFANYTGWTYTDKELYIASLTDPDYKSLCKKALKDDRASLIWELGLGTDPTTSFDGMMREMYTDCFYYFKKNLKFKPDESQRFGQLFIKIADRLNAIDDKNKESHDIFSELKLGLETTDTIKDKSQRDSSQKVINMDELDFEIPEPVTSQQPIDLDKIMNGEPE